MMSNEQKISDIIVLHKGVISVLIEHGNAEDVFLANDIFRKFLTVSAASCLEEEAKKTIRELVREISGGTGGLLRNFVDRGVLKRSYHTLFDWERDNANHFYAFFGSAFRKFMLEKEGENEDFANAAKCFVHLGRERNKLVHNNLAAADFEWTEDDVEKRFRQAETFLPKFLRYALEFAREQTGEESPPAP